MALDRLAADDELGIARLVMERRTNSEIAAELVVSRKTVESHVSNILRKLGVASRVEIGGVIDRHGTASVPPDRSP